jgi:hypothetical protein
LEPIRPPPRSPGRTFRSGPVHPSALG